MQENDIIGRAGGIVPADNSPAHWMVMRCYDMPTPTLDQLRKIVPEIPMTMRMSQKVADTCPFKMRLDDYSDTHAGTSGWYLAHKEPVGIGRIKVPLEALPLKKLQKHFKLLMRPSNMVLVARTVSGLAEIDGWIG